MTTAIQDHIGSLNWGYRVALRSRDVNYLNSYGEFVGPHKIKVKAVEYGFRQLDLLIMITISIIVILHLLLI